jgi:hypothetical protein
MEASMPSLKNNKVDAPNRLTLIERRGSKWLARCLCNAEVLVDRQRVRRNNTRSCGCLRYEILKKGTKPKRLALPGQRFGKLVVQAEAGRTKDGKRLVKTKCDCGSVHVVRAGSLAHRTEPTRSCGCLRGRPKRNP